MTEKQINSAGKEKKAINWFHPFIPTLIITVIYIVIIVAYHYLKYINKIEIFNVVVIICDIIVLVLSFVYIIANVTKKDDEKLMFVKKDSHLDLLYKKYNMFINEEINYNEFKNKVIKDFKEVEGCGLRLNSLCCRIESYEKYLNSRLMIICNGIFLIIFAITGLKFDSLDYVICSGSFLVFAQILLQKENYKIDKAKEFINVLEEFDIKDNNKE